MPRPNGSRSAAISDRLKLAEFGAAEPEVGEAEQCVAVLVEFGREPRRRARPD